MAYNINRPTAFLNGATNTSREAEVAAASFVNGANSAAGCSPGIGITEPLPLLAMVPDIASVYSGWTFNDQGFMDPNGELPDEPVAPVARQPQVGQYVGGPGFTQRNTQPTEDDPSSGGVSGNGNLPNDNSAYITGYANADNIVDPLISGATIAGSGTPTVVGSMGMADTIVCWAAA